MAKTKQVNLRIPIDVIDKYQALSDLAEDRDRSYFMKKAIVSFVSDKPKPKVKTQEKPSILPAVDSVIDYLNLKAGTAYKKTKSSREPIGARLSDFSTQDCYTVIDKKCREWLGTDMAKYLRPQTLFQASKFEGYLNQPEGGNHEASRPKSLAERSQQQTAYIQSQLAAGGFDQRPMGSHGAALSSPVDKVGGREADLSESIDGEFSLVVQEDGASYR